MVSRTSYKITVIALAVMALVVVDVIYFNPTLFSGSSTQTSTTNKMGINASTYIEIRLTQYGGLVPSTMARIDSVIYNNGSIIVKYKNNRGDATRIYTRSISRSQLEDLAKLIVANNFFSSKYTYPTCPQYFDVPTREIWVKIGDKEEKLVRNPDVDGCLPPDLSNLVFTIKALEKGTIEGGTVYIPPGKGPIMGYVRDNNENGVANVTVGIVNGTSPFPSDTKLSDSEGLFWWDDIEPGTYQVAVFDGEGRNIQVQDVEVVAWEGGSVIFHLQTRP